MFDVATNICCFIVGCCVFHRWSFILLEFQNDEKTENVHVEKSHEESDEKHQQTGSGIGRRTQSCAVSKVGRLRFIHVYVYVSFIFI